MMKVFPCLKPKFSWVNPRLCRRTYTGLTDAAVALQAIAISVLVTKRGQGGFFDGDLRFRAFQIPLDSPLLKGEAKIAAALGAHGFSRAFAAFTQ